MCGIVGIVSENASHFIEMATEKLSHRGPDDYGYYKDLKLSFGHRRLSILDTSENGHQPMYSNDSNYVIIFNGEIYNHLEIRESYLSKYIFKSTSDTETILYGYIEFGDKLFNMLNGIFALSIYNKLTEELIIVRDQFGVKPLYYTLNNNSLSFASELKSLLFEGSFDKELNMVAIQNYINFLWSPGELTPFMNVKKLLPGHFIKLNVNKPSNIEIKKYYDIPFSGEYESLTEEELIDKLDLYLENSVRRQLLSDVPVGFFLSGGLDSSLMVAYARKINPNKKIDCFTIDTGVVSESEGFSNDLYYSKIVAEHLNVDLNIVKADINIVRDFDKMIYHLDEPQADAAPLNVYNICLAAREKGYKVLIGGTAGDDLFSGYRRHQAISYERYYNFIPKFISTTLKKISTFLSPKVPLFRRIRKLLIDINKSKLERMAGYFRWIPIKLNLSLFSAKNRLLLKNNNPNNYLYELLKNIPNENSDLNKMLYWELKTFLVDHNLNYSDKLSMAAGVEARVPFLDKELLEFSTKIPAKYKLKGMTTKYILKKVAERYLSKEVIYRTKAGFGAPVRKWITEDMDLMISNKLSKSNIEAQGIFNFESVNDLIQMNKKGEIDASYTIWGLLAIESWYSQFVNVK